MIVQIHLKNGDMELIEAKDIVEFFDITKKINQYQAFISTKLYIPVNAIAKVKLLEEEM